MMVFMQNDGFLSKLIETSLFQRNTILLLRGFKSFSEDSWQKVLKHSVKNYDKPAFQNLVFCIAVFTPETDASNNTADH